jgi:hypothetical protein
MQKPAPAGFALITSAEIEASSTVRAFVLRLFCFLSPYMAIGS